MAGGGIGVEYSLRGLPKMLPGLILCVIFGWLALQWDTTIHAWEKDAKESEKILKSWDEGKPVLPYADYVQKAKDGFAKKEAEFKAKKAEYEAHVAALPAGEKPTLKEPKKPSKPHLLQQADYDKLAQTKSVDGKFAFGKLMIEFQLTYVAVLLLVGMVIRNTIGLPDFLKAGTVAARPLIKPGIIILGAYYLWSNVFKVGAISLALIVAFVLGTAILVSIWGRRAKVDDGLAGVMGAGVGVCGVSAAVAVAPVVNAKPRDFFYAIGTILLFGTIALFTFPYIGQALGMSEPVFGAWVGTSILNTAQLVAAATWYGHDALLTANILNIVRVAFIPLVVLWAIYYYVVRPVVAAGGAAEKVDHWQVIKDKFPIFIFGFFIMVTLNEFGVFTEDQTKILAGDLLKLFFAVGFAGVGLNIAFDDLRKAGGAAFMVGFVSATLKAVLAAIVVIALGTEVFAVK